MITKAPIASSFHIGTCTSQTCHGIHIVPMGDDEKPIAEMVLSQDQALWLVSQILDLLGIKATIEHGGSNAKADLH